MSIIKNKQLGWKEWLGSYLAGLIEGDGSIIISKDNKHSPRISIVFDIKDTVLAEFLMIMIGGQLYKQKNSIVLKFYKQSTILYIIELVNGYFRGPKIITLHKLILYMNDKHTLHIPLLPLNITSIHSDAWFNGFIDSDGHFYLSWKEKVDKDSILGVRWYMTLKQKLYYLNLSENNHLVLFSFINNSLFENTAHCYVNKPKDLNEVIIIGTHTIHSKYCLISYLTKFPLLGYKYINTPIFIELLTIRIADSKVRSQPYSKTVLQKLNSLRKVDNYNRFLHKHHIYSSIY